MPCEHKKKCDQKKERIRINMKKYILFIYLFCYQSGLWAQSTDSYLNNFAQPAPNAATLGKYADYPIGYYTGTPSISIPIYDLQDGGAKMAISLSYHPSGIRVSEVASWVGLGWALNAGGMIIRTVKGAPDEGTFKGTNTTYGPAGYFLNYGLSTLPSLPYPVGGQIPDNLQNQEMTSFTIPGVNGGFYDTEPDLFTFNFNGYTGKFVFDENRTTHLLVDDNMQIVPNFDSNGFDTWTITTSDGTKYYFGENSIHEITSPSSTSSGSDPDAQRPSSWYLTRIVYPNTKDTIYLSYTPESYSYHELGPETSLFGIGSSKDVSWACSDPSYNNIITTTITGWRLSAIRSKNYNISFVARNSRQDMLYTSNMLDSIKINTTQGQCLKQFALTHAYFTSTSATGLNASLVSFMNDNTDMSRLKLQAVTEYSGDGMLGKPAYKLTYQESFQLPRRMSYDQDHWGFSNNSTGSNNAYFTPGLNYPVCSVQTGGLNANRTPKWPDMSAFSLISIKNPLGVLTNFQFEAHIGMNTYPTLSTVGGLRIKQITTTDSVTGIMNYRSYQYPSGGILYKTPVYLYDLNNEYYTSNGTFTSASYRGYGFVNIISSLLRQSQSILPLQDFQGNHIGYVNVIETIGARGEGGSKQYFFEGDIAVHNNSRLDMSNYTATSFINTFYGTVGGIFGNGLFNGIPPSSLQYYLGYNVDNYYPAAPEQVDLRRGKLIAENTFDSLGNLLKSTQNRYVESYHENYLIRGFKAYRTSSLIQSGSTLIFDALAYYKLHTGISHLRYSTETDYKDGKTMVINHNYGYEDTLHTLQTSDTSTTSQGDSIIKKTYYSFDYANGATSDNIFGKMKIRNVLLPVSSRLWKNNLLIKGTVTLFQDFASSSTDTFINPAKIYSLETTTPLTPVQASENIAFTSAFTTLLPNTYFIEKADFNIHGTTGRIIEQRLANDKNQALVWDNTYALPLAQVDNAYFADVAYCSFESSETGNWTFSSNSVVVDATAPTGGFAYSLAGSISKSGLNTSQSYVLSYWLKSGASLSVSGATQSNSVTGRTLNGYTYHEVKLTAATSITITGSGNVDELRLYPFTAHMTTFTYDALRRLIAECSPNSTISYYDYDSFNRVVDIRDQFGNVIKAFEYNYGQSAR
jgi:hypothetical protein